MNELLILYALTKGQTTMYGLSKYIQKYFGFLTVPSFGTIQPTIKKLENNKIIKTQKFITDGGKPYNSYTITNEGITHLKSKMLEPFGKIPINIYSNIKIRFICADILDNSEKQSLYKMLKTELYKLKQNAEILQNNEFIKDNSSTNLVLDATICEYKNMIEIIERFENACNN